MAAVRQRNAWERRLREIDREKRRLRQEIQEVRRWADSSPEAAQYLQEARQRSAGRSRNGPPAEALPPPVAVGVLELDSPDIPDQEVALDFSPGPDGLDTKRVVMPRLQRTDLLRPPLGGHLAATRLNEPEYDRFRSYFGTTGLKRVREARRDRGSHRIRAIFMILMVVLLSYILVKMVT